MKKNLLKSILMTLALVFGVTGVWAAEGNAVVKMTYVDFDTPTTAIGEIAAGETARCGFNKISGGEVGFGNTGWGENKITYIQVDASAIEGTITGATLTAEVTGSSDSKRTCTYGVGYNASTWSAGLTYETADKSITLVGDTYGTSTKSGSTFETATFDISKALVGDEDKVVTILMYETAAAGGYVKNPTVTITYLSASEAAEYTVKYVCDGTEVKEAKTGVAAIGGTYTVTDEDKASCMFNDVKYIYVSDDAASQTIKQDGSTVITVTFRQAEKYAYTLKSSLGTTLVEGSDWEGETLKVAYPRHLLSDGTLYTTPEGDKNIGYFRKQFTLTENNHEETIEYTAGETGIVFLSEAEAIKTLTTSTAANADIRCSNGLCAYNAGQGDTTIVVLPAGKYKLFSSAWGNEGTSFVFKAGAETILSIDTKGYIVDAASEEFTLNKTTAITLGATDNAGRGIDFVYIQKTGDVALVSTPRKWDFTSMNKADDALLAAQVEAGVWTNQKGRFQNDNTVFNNEVIAINGTEIEFTKGLLFTADKKKLLLGRNGETKNNFMQVQKGASFILPDLAVGDTVRATVQTSSKTATTLAALDAETVKVVEGFEASTSKHACTFVMLKDANVTLKGDNSDLRFLNLEVITPVVAKVPAAGELNFNKMDIKVSANGSTEGDILKDTTFVVENEFNVTVTPKASGTTENRFWGTNDGPQLRMYNGTLTVKAAEGKTINKITFNVDETKWEGITPDAGTLTKTTWEGEAETVVFTLTKQCRINAITVGETTPAISVAENIAAFKALAEETEATLTLTDAQLTVSRIASNISGFVAVLTDASGSISVSNDIAMGLFAEQGFAEGTTLNGKLTGMFMTVNGIPTIAASENTGNAAIDSFTGSEGKVTATEATVADAKKAENLLKVVELKNITLEAVAGEFRTFTATQGEDQIGVNDVFMNMMTGTCVLDEFMDENTGEYKDLPEFESLTAVVFANMEGTNVLYPMAYVAKVAQDEIPVVWDFTQWSEETVNNLKADAATIEPVDNGDGTFTYPTVTPWRSYEKVGGPTDTDPDRGGAAFWYGTAIEEAQTITANGVAIAETDGLLFDKMTAGSLAIAIDYPSTSLGTYAGPAYLWIGGKTNSFTIPAVKPGSTIEIKLESHKNTDARGVKLSVGGVEIGQAVPTTVETFRIEVPASEAETVDVKVENTNGCHIYTIGITDYTKITAINGVINNVENTNNDVYSINGVKVRNTGESLNGLAKGLYIIGGKKVVIK